MAKVNTILHFPGNCSEAFEHYKTVFGTEYMGEITRYGQDAPKGAEHMIAYISLPTIGSHILNGADTPEQMGQHLTIGNNFYIMLEPDSRTAADRLYAGLSEAGTAEQPMTEQPWGYFGRCIDQFGVQWAFSCPAA